jgi:hypothetical protein
MYKTILETDDVGQQRHELFSQKRYDNFELHNLPINYTSHASHASHGLQSHHTSTSFQTRGASDHSLPSYIPPRKEKDRDKKQKVIQKILRDDSIEDDHRREQETTLDNGGTTTNENTHSLHQDGFPHEVKNIDDVFIRITDIYTQELYNIIYNTLNIMINNDTDFNIYIDGLNKILEPTNNRIKKWIDENIVF